MTALTPYTAGRMLCGLVCLDSVTRKISALLGPQVPGCGDRSLVAKEAELYRLP
jgi:hypothetical protein